MKLECTAGVYDKHTGLAYKKGEQYNIGDVTRAQELIDSGYFKRVTSRKTNKADKGNHHALPQFPQIPPFNSLFKN